MNPLFPKYRLLLCVAVGIAFFTLPVYSQTVIGGDTMDASAMLDVQSIDRGVLLPRLTTAQRDAIARPAFGLMVLNTTLQCVEINLGSAVAPEWKCLSTAQGMLNLSALDTAYWNRKLGAGDTLSLSARIEAKVGLPSSGNNLGNMLYWNGTTWVRLSTGLPGQVISLSPDGVPTWTGAALAMLATTPPSAITPTSAVVGGQITADGGANVSARGIAWGTSANPSLSSGVLALGSGTGSFSATLGGLSPNTVYYLRAYATNSAGTAYGNQQSFTTLPVGIPALTTNAISSITQTSAIAGGNITNDGGAAITRRGVAYGTSQNPALSGAFTQDGAGTGNFTSTLSGLAPNTTYYVRAYATNSAGTAYGEQESFVTQVPAVPSLSTRELINVTNATATSGGVISNDGSSAITAKGVVWATAPNPTLSDNKTNDGGGAATYPAFLTGLAPGTTYYVRAYATNGVGTGYGNQLSFTTALVSNTAAVVQTLSVTDIALQQATVHAEVSAEGGGTVTERGIVWNTGGNPTVNSNRIPLGSGTGTYQTTISGLTGGTSYYARAYAVNAFGIAYGQELAFTTAVGVPLVSTNALLTGTDKTIQGGGNVTEAGGSAVTARGLVYATTNNPTIADGKTTAGSGLGAFTSTITGLTSNTTYFVRAYATNSTGTGYGSELSFTTDATETPGPPMTDIDGNTYSSVQIGSQVWTSSNLRTARYRNGDLIPYVVGNGDWQSGSTGKWSYYNHDEANNTTYGKLYNGHAVADPRGLCPSGWHVPDRYELAVLSTHLGGDAVAGGKLKATTLWNVPNTGATNSSGFAAVPGGRREQDGAFAALGSSGQYWSTGTTTYRFASTTASLEFVFSMMGQGNAVRCVKNSVPILTTRPIVAISSTTIFTGGEILADGGEAISAKGVVWATTPNPTTADNKTTNGAGAAGFSSSTPGLLEGVTYYVRAYATNSLGTGYGNEISFVFNGSPVGMHTLSGGTFSMGCTQDEQECNGYPVHTVTLSAFQVGETEVTQALWQSVMGSNPSAFSSCAQCPAERVSWYDAVVFCNRLSEAQGLAPCYYSDGGFTQVYGKSGGSWSLPNSGEVHRNPLAKGYRLPTEAEWEYAARGGSATNIYAGSNNPDEVAWHYGNSPGGTKPVKGKLANSYGLYDMSGNVWEWCQDWYGNYSSSAQTNPEGPDTGSGRVGRGGSWDRGPQYCRVAYRVNVSPGGRGGLGFRLARTL